MQYKVFADLKDGKGVRPVTVKPNAEKAQAEVERLLKGKTRASRAYAIPMREQLTSAQDARTSAATARRAS